MAFSAPTDALNRSEGLCKEHEGNVLTAMHNEQALKHLLENLPDEKVLKRPYRRRLATKCSQVLSYIFIHLQRRQAAIPLFLDRQPSARSQLAARGKLAVVGALPSPAATLISIDQTPQTPTLSIPERRLRDEQEENGEMGICREMPHHPTASQWMGMSTTACQPINRLPTSHHQRGHGQMRLSPRVS